MNVATELEPAVPETPAAPVAESPLARARVHRKLTVEEAARRAGLHPEEVRWLEDGRVYRFSSSDHALLATLLLASALGIEHREALELAGRPVPPLPPSARRRIAVVAAFALLVAALVGAFQLGGAGGGRTTKPRAALPAPWTVKVVVLNGSGDINATRQLASRIGALGYTIQKVGRADRFNYLQTAVYYAPGGQDYAVRLAKQICAPVKPLPGGDDPRRVVVIAGPPTVAC